MHDIATCETPSCNATFGDLLTIQLSKFCRDQEQYFPNQNKPFINHENKTIQQLVTYKKELRKKAFSQSDTKDHRKKFHGFPTPQNYTPFNLIPSAPKI